MRTVYHFPHEQIVKETTGQTLLSNGFGDFFCLADDLSYNGWHHFRHPWGVHKSIESLTPLDEGEQHTMHHHLYGVRRAFVSGAEDMIIPYQQVLLYQTRQLSGRVRLTLDHRHAYDGSKLGRRYTIKEQGNHLLIRFNDEHWLCIKGHRSHEPIEHWREQHYAQDARRGAQADYWVYDALTFVPGAHVVIASGESESQARTRADIASCHFQDIITARQHEQARHILETEEHHTSAQLASWSLHQTLQLFSRDHHLQPGMYAGLPWFFQIWSRDELISLGGLMAHQGDSETAKAILDRYHDQLIARHELPNRYPHSDLASADALGWYAHRLEWFLRSLGETELLTRYQLDELNDRYVALHRALEHVKQLRGEGLLIRNDAKETWMDTTWHDEGRPGIRIEVQALQYCVYRALAHLGTLLGKETFEDERKEFIKAVRERFGEPGDGFHPDGRRDTTIRPNLFLALYLAPELFSNWHGAIERHLSALELSWGGLATLDREDPLYQPSYTGQDDRSYHRGDSWYWVNNLAAVALHRLDAKRYAEIIDGIIRSSKKDLLELGFAGHTSEVSSAAIQGGEGSPVQTWSAATFLELFCEVREEF